MYKIMLQARLEFEELVRRLRRCYAVCLMCSMMQARYYWNFYDIAAFGGIVSARDGDMLAKQANCLWGGTPALKAYINESGASVVAALDSMGAIAQYVPFVDDLRSSHADSVGGRTQKGAEINLNNFTIKELEAVKSLNLDAVRHKVGLLMIRFQSE